MPYAVIQDDPGVIFGVGDTEEDAWAEAKEWIGKGSSLDGLEIFPCTPALAALVQEGGGDITFGKLSDGRLCAANEE